MTKVLKWLIVIIFCIIVIFVVAEVINQRNIRVQGEAYLLEHNNQIFQKYAANYSLQFSSYIEAREYFRVQAQNPKLWHFSLYEHEKSGKVFMTGRLKAVDGICTQGLLDLTTKAWSVYEEGCIQTLK